MRKVFFILLMAITVTGVAAQTNPLAGSLWKIDSTSAAGTHYLHKIKWQDAEQEIASDHLRFEKGKLYKTLRSCTEQYGIYEVESNLVTLRPRSSSSPVDCDDANFAKAQYSYKINGSHMILTLIKEEQMISSDESSAEFSIPTDITKDLPRYKKYAGIYGSSSGIALFDDGRFLFYGYATAVPGSYYFEEDFLLFYPDKPKNFEVYATHNPDIGNKVKANFIGFEKGDTYVKLDNHQNQKVFNDDANCFGGPFVKMLGPVPSQIRFFNRADADEKTLTQISVFTYNNAAKYNDFIFIHNAPSRYDENFSAVMDEDESSGVKRLLFSPYSNETGFVRNVKPEEAESWQGVAEIKADLDRAKNLTFVYANKHYNVFQNPELSLYKYDKKSNQLISKNLAENEEYWRSNQYHDNRYLRKFERQELLPAKNMEFTAIVGQPLFYTACEGTQKSYKYDGFKTTREVDNREKAPMLLPIPLPSQMLESK